MNDCEIQNVGRLAALHRYQILDSYPEVAFERITQMAARIFKVPIAFISLVDNDRVWFKSRYGILPRETPRLHSFCDAARDAESVLVIPDTSLDARFENYTLVKRKPPVRFYAGAPLVTPDRFRIGALSIMDIGPRPHFTSEQQRTLADLAAIVVDEMELRLASRWGDQPCEEPNLGDPAALSDSREEEEVSITLLDDPRNKFVAYLFDLSDSGIGVVSEFPLPAGAQVLLEGHQLAVRGEVRYSFQTKVGFQSGIHALEVVSPVASLLKPVEAFTNAEVAAAK